MRPGTAECNRNKVQRLPRRLFAAMMPLCCILHIEVGWTDSKGGPVPSTHLGEFAISSPFVLNIVSASSFLHECFYPMSQMLFIPACIRQKPIEPC